MDPISILSAITLVSNIALAIFILLFLISRLGIFKARWRLLVKKITPRAILLAFIVALTATAGSLYLSEVRGFEPCKLCWFQRVFMYPLPILLGVALWKKTQDVWQYVKPLSIIGLLIAIYHYYYQVSGSTLIPCSTVGFSVSCSQRFFTYYGYITIPWMSLSAFALITVAMLLVKYKVKK